MSLLGPQLDAFMAVVKHKTVHAAADILCLTQTAVTQRIKTLETNLRTTLFTRTRRGMTLTQEGKSLLHYCNAASQLEGEVLAKIKGEANESHIQVSISGPSSLQSSRVLPTVSKLAEQFHQLRFHFIYNDNETRHKSLKEGDVDFAIMEPEDAAPEMATKLLKPEKYVLVAPTKWKGRKLADIVENESIIDFDPADKITYSYLKQYGLFDKAKHDRYFANQTNAVARLTAQGIGYTSLTQEFAKPYVDRGELIILNKNQTYEHQMLLAWYERPEPPAYFTAIIEAVN